MYQTRIMIDQSVYQRHFIKEKQKSKGGKWLSSIMIKKDNSLRENLLSALK